MLVTFFKDLFVVKHEFFPVGQTMNYAFDIKVPKYLTAKNLAEKAENIKNQLDRAP
jgi:hypothetical protein